jgi:hypothetical protein
MFKVNFFISALAKINVNAVSVLATAEINKLTLANA